MQLARFMQGKWCADDRLAIRSEDGKISVYNGDALVPYCTYIDRGSVESARPPKTYVLRTAILGYERWLCIADREDDSGVITHVYFANEWHKIENVTFEKD